MAIEVGDRNAWRFIDYTRDVFMHHRKFTPIQKFGFLTTLVGVLFLMFRNIWMLVIMFTYGVSVYLSREFSKYVCQRKQCMSSDAVLIFVEKVEMFLSYLLVSSPASFVSNDTNQNKGENHKMSLNETNKSTPDKINTENDEKTIDNAETTETEFLQKHLDLDVGCELIKTNDIGRTLPVEVQKLLRLIQRDFVESWYRLFSHDEAGLFEVQSVLCHVFKNIEGRISKTKCMEVLKDIIIIYRNHVKNIKQSRLQFSAQKKRRKSLIKPLTKTENPPNAHSVSNSQVTYNSLAECYAVKFGLHPATRSEESEKIYQRAIMEMLLIHLLPDELYDSKSVTCSLKEMLMCNILRTVVNLVSEETFLHECVIKITSDEVPGSCSESQSSVTVIESNTSSEIVQSSQEKITETEDDTKLASLASTIENIKDIKDDVETERRNSDSSDTVFYDVKWKEDTTLHPVEKKLCLECNRQSSKDKDRISPRQHTCSLGAYPAFFDSSDPDRVSICSSASSEEKPLFQISDENDTSPTIIPKIVTDIPGKVGELLNSAKSANGSTGESKEKVHKNSEVEAESKVPNLFPFSLSNPFSSMMKSKSNFLERKRSSPNFESAEEAEVLDKTDIRKSKSAVEVHIGPSPSTSACATPLTPNIPSLFGDVRIISTTTAKERGRDANYTLYEVEYVALTESDTGVMVNKTGTVSRRFSEFVNLQSRLEDNPSYKKSLKDVKGPKKILPSLPFGNMGKEIIEGRKDLLDSFLKALITHEDICNGGELREFLGYSGDGHIAFVRKASDASGQRMDQRLVKTMSGMFDKIVEGLPSLPPQLPKFLPQTETRDWSEGQLEDLDSIDLEFVTDTHANTSSVELALDQVITKATWGDEEVMDVTLGMSILAWQDRVNKDRSGEVSVNVAVEKTETSDTVTTATSNQQDITYAVATLDTLAELLHGQDNWTCRANMIHTVNIFFGLGLNRVIKSKMASLFTEEMRDFYLRTLQETVWPDDTLTTDPRPTLTDLQRDVMRKQAARCLGDFLPGLLRPLLGDEDFEFLVQEAMQSIEHEKLNRHFWYCVLDIILEHIFPEILKSDLQRKLSCVDKT